MKDYIKNVICFLKENESFFITVSLNIIESCIHEFIEHDWDFILVDLDFFVVMFVERIGLLG
jgi:hypothetical protein